MGSGGWMRLGPRRNRYRLAAEKEDGEVDLGKLPAADVGPDVGSAGKSDRSRGATFS